MTNTQHTQTKDIRNIEKFIICSRLCMYIGSSLECDNFRFEKIKSVAPRHFSPFLSIEDGSSDPLICITI